MSPVEARDATTPPIHVLAVVEVGVDVAAALYRLNHRPRKCLNYRTPHEVFMDLEMRPLN